MTRKPGGTSGGNGMLASARAALRNSADHKKAADRTWFFKFPKEAVLLGVRVPVIWSIAKRHRTLPSQQHEFLMKSRIHEEWTLAHSILRDKYARGSVREREPLLKYYLKNGSAIRSWKRLEDSAPYIVRAWLLNRDKSLQDRLAHAKRIWDRRIAIVATLCFIRAG